MNNQLNAGAEAIKQGREKISRELGGMVSEATDLMKNLSAQNLDHAKQYAAVTDDYVRANPWTALGVAAAAGVLIGVLLARR